MSARESEASALKFYHLWEAVIQERDELRNATKELLASIHLRAKAKEVFNRSIDSGSERWAEAQLIRADRRYSKAFLVAKSLIQKP